MFIHFTQQKNIRTLVGAVSLSLVSLAGFAQEKAVQQIQRSTDLRRLTSLQSELQKKNEEAKKRVEEFYKRRALYNTTIPSNGINPDGVAENNQLMDIGADGTLYYYSTDNDDAAKTTSTDKLHPSSGLGYNLTGEGESIGIWDSGIVREYHEIFTGRAFTKEGLYDNRKTTLHATHVGGTMVGALNAAGGRAGGMAPNAKLLSYDWNNDKNEIIDAIQQENLLISNHSYSWNPLFLPKYAFGKYSEAARDIDKIANNAPYYLHVRAAANDRQRLQSKGGYNIIYGEAVAKNVLTVAAVEKVEEYQGPSSVRMSAFSNWGPTDDGRIKPDISGNGVSVYSSSDQNNSAYRALSGTSMASPNVSGSLLLLQQYYKRLNGFYMESSMLKGLALHTASEAGRNPGPDYEYGWGLLNAEKAAETIKNNGELSMIKQINLDNNEVYTFKVRKNANNEPLMVSITWNDIAFNVTPNDSTLDNPTAMLVNDLDVRVTDTENKTYLPWKLDPNNPSAGATRGDNVADNIEKVEVVDGIEGEVYTVTISHKGRLTGNRQSVAIVVTGGRRVSGDCNISQWSRTKAYTKGEIVEYLGDKFEAKNWSQAEPPFVNDQWGPWKFIGSCSTLGNNAPEISIVAPAANAEFRGKKKISFSVKVTDVDNDLASVVLIKQNEKGLQQIEPVAVNGDLYTFEYVADWFGEYTNTFVAIDSKGSKKTETYNFVLGELQDEPVITFLNYNEGDVVYGGSQNLIDLEILGIYGKNLKVVLSVKSSTSQEVVQELNSLENEQTLFGYTYVGPDVTKSEDVQLKVQITTQEGQVVAEKQLQVVLVPNAAPVLELLSYDDKLFTSLETVEIRVKATDNDDTVSKVIFTYKTSGNTFEEVEMVKNGDIYTAQYTLPHFLDSYYNVVRAIDSRGRESEPVFIHNRISGEKPNQAPIVNFYRLNEGHMFEYKEGLEVPFVLETYNKYEEGPEYVLLSEVYLNDEMVAKHIHNKKYGLGMETSVRVPGPGKYTLKVRTLDERGAWGENQLTFHVVDAPQGRVTNLVDGQTYQLKIGESIDIHIEGIKKYGKIKQVNCYLREFVNGGRMPFFHYFTTSEAISATSYEPKNGLSTIQIDIVVIDEYGFNSYNSMTIYTDKEEVQPPYPNPTTGIVNLPWDTSMGKLNAYVYDLNYKRQFSQTFENKEEFQLDLGGLKKGVYIVVVESSRILYRKEYRIIVE